MRRVPCLQTLNNFLHFHFEDTLSLIFRGTNIKSNHRKCLRDLQKEATTCTDLAVMGHARTEIEAAKFEKAEFELVSQKLKSDIRAVLIFRSKQESHRSLIYHAKMNQQRKRRLHESAATLFPGPCAMFSFVTSVETMLASAETRIPFAAATPGIGSSELGSTIHRTKEPADPSPAFLPEPNDFDAMGVILMPVWERSKGSMHKSESLLLKNLSERDVNTDDKHP